MKRPGKDLNRPGNKKVFTMQWTKDLAVGVDEIDNQHKELFSRINNLVVAIKKAECKYVIDGTVKFLEDYAVIHFTAEEGYMTRYNYPEYRQHRDQHEIFLNSLNGLKKLAATPREGVSFYELSVTTNQVVVDWIVSHVAAVDKRLGDFLKVNIIGDGGM